MATSEPSLGDLDDFDLDDGGPNLGDRAAQDDEQSQILGDISLLEEAIAELETDSEETQDEDSLALSADDEVPVLDDAVDLTNTVFEYNQQQRAGLSPDESIPVLEDIAEDMDANSAFSAADLQGLASSLVGGSDSVTQPTSLSEPLLEMPMDNPSVPSAAEESNISIGEQLSQLSQAVEHTVAVGGNTRISIDLPGELHAQLSKKIDSLVIEATTSITNELHHQLTQRMDQLLTDAVESVLPNLMEQLAQGLRQEVKSKVKTEIPNIINDVLSNARLTEEVD